MRSWFRTDEEQRPSMFIESTLEGIEIDLPHPLGKQPRDARPIALQVTLLDEPMVNVLWGDISAVIHTREQGGLHGSVGISVPPPEFSADDSGLIVAGRMNDIDLTSDGSGSIQPREWPRVLFQDMHIGEVTNGSFRMSDIRLDGLFDWEAMDLTLSSNEFNGRVFMSDEGRMFADIASVRVLINESADRSDPLSPDFINWLPDMDISIQEIVVVDQEGTAANVGSWSMAVDKFEDEIRSDTA